MISYFLIDIQYSFYGDQLSNLTPLASDIRMYHIALVRWVAEISFDAHPPVC